MMTVHTFEAAMAGGRDRAILARLVETAQLRQEAAGADMEMR